MNSMTFRARVFIGAVLLVGLALSGLAWFGGPDPASQLPAFALLTGLATLAQLFKTEVPKHQFYYATKVFQFAGALILPPFLLVPLIALPHLIEWATARISNSEHLRAWYIQPFNIATHIIAGLAAHLLYTTLAADPAALSTPSSVVAAVAAAACYLMLNHLFIGQVLVMVNGVSWRESRILGFESLFTDFVLLLMGFTLAVLWRLAPWVVLPSLAPLVLLYRALAIPRLKREALTDEKTGLWNARHFGSMFKAELDRSKRFSRPLSLLITDLDLLRNINNTYGHLAGDMVLRSVGGIIRDSIRKQDIAARFGGEEFAIVLPETEVAEAQAIAERLRLAVECATFEAPNSSTPIRATMSIGVACYPFDATAPNDLIHEADVAVYHAKLYGRNCVVRSCDVPDPDDPRAAQHANRLDSPYAAAFVTRPRLPEEIPGYGGSGASVALAPAAETTTKVSAEHRPVDKSVPTKDSRQTGALQRSRGYPRLLLPLFVGGVIAAGALSAILGFTLQSNYSLFAVGVLVLFAVVAELLQVNLYGPDTVSVGVAILFAAALITGVPGVVYVSAAIVLVHYLRRRPMLYKTVFNWAMHLLAGLVPVVFSSVLRVDLVTENLLLLVVPMAAASLIYYVLETGLISVAIGIAGEKSPLKIWREQFQWLAGHYLVLCTMGLFLGIAYTDEGPMGFAIFALPVLMMRFSQKQYVERTEDGVRELRRMNEELSRANQEVVAANEAVQELNEELFLTLSKIIDARDPYVGSHAEKVADYAVAIAKELGVPAENHGPLRQAGFLHDIGKIAISEAVLHKPTKLTVQEYEYLKKHAPIGGEFVETCRSLRHLAPFIRHHHERWDGKGYPDGLAGEEIPIEARILSICDAAEAMSSDRPYREAMSITEVIAEIKRCAGTQFDPTVAEAFIRVVEREKDQLIVNSAHEAMRKQSDNIYLIHVRNSGPPVAVRS